MIDFKVEFGRIKDEQNKAIIILADEISLIIADYGMLKQKKLDKDIFRKDLGDLIDGYQEVASRLGIKIN